MDTTVKMVVSITMVVMIALIMAEMVQAQEYPEPVEPTQYCCPICEQMGTPSCFTTYDALYTHFVNAHPAQPIDIIWS